MDGDMASDAVLLSRDAVGIRALIARHLLVSYFVIAYAGAWLAVLPLLLAQNGLGILPVRLPAPLFTLLGALAGPTLAAYIVTGVTAGRAGVADLLRRCLRWRTGVQWYLFAIFGPLCILTLGATALLGPVVLANLAQKWPSALVVLVAGALVGVVTGGPLGEEPGWRGVAQPRLERQYGPLRGLLILGGLWGVWHLPGFFGGWLGVPFSIPAFLFIVISAMAGAVVYGWVYNHTGSLLVAILLHAAGNAALGVGGLVLPAAMPAWQHSFIFTYGGLSATSMAIAALLIAGLTRGRLGYQPEVIESRQQPLGGESAE